MSKEIHSISQLQRLLAVQIQKQPGKRLKSGKHALHQSTEILIYHQLIMYLGAEDLAAPENNSQSPQSSTHQSTKRNINTKHRRTQKTYSGRHKFPENPKTWKTKPLAWMTDPDVSLPNLFLACANRNMV